MNFVSNIFIYLFMPAFFICYLALWVLSKKVPFLRKIRIGDIFTILMSLLFYMWAGFNNVFFLIIFMIFVFMVGKIVEKTRGISIGQGCIKIMKWIQNKSIAFWCTVIGIVVCVYGLYKFKYSGQVTITLSDSISMPLGISFLTFSAISYVADIYEGESAGDIIDATLYLSFFPKVISGPIVQWTEFRKQLSERKISVNGCVNGICEIVIGFAKKVLIADYFGSVIADIQWYSKADIDIPTAWLICILYMFQIYYDFSGYSNIAIGISKFIGIKFERNFNFPYLSTSIAEFWRRWHISLGTWFKKYVYIPLGGNRKGTKRTLINLFLVMFISGIWHGVGLAYLLWGIMHGACVVFERVVGDKNWYRKIPKAVKWAVTMFIVMMGWEIFRIGTFSGVVDFLKILLGITRSTAISFTYQYYFTTKLLIMLIIAFAGATVLGWLPNTKAWKKICNSHFCEMVKYVLILVLMIVCMICVTNSTYSPFIYFQY